MTPLLLEQQFFKALLPELRRVNANQDVPYGTWTKNKNPWLKRAYDCTTLDALVYQGEMELVEKILAWSKAHAKLGVDVGMKRAWGKIIEAPPCCQEQLVHLFCEAGMDLNARFESRADISTLLIEAIHLENIPLTMTLLEHGANPNYKPPQSHNSLLNQLFTSCFLNANFKGEEVFEALFKHGLELDIPKEKDVPSKKDGSLLRLLTRCPRLVPVLFDHGLDPNQKIDGKPLLYWVMEVRAVYQADECESLTLALLQAGADVSVEVDGKSLAERNRSYVEPIFAIEAFSMQQKLQETLDKSTLKSTSGPRL